jgi:predicted nucleotidyltransferase
MLFAMSTQRSNKGTGLTVPPGGLLAHVRSQRAELLAIAERYGAVNLRIFGSAVRGDERPDSDVDLLAVLPDSASLFDLAGFQLELEAALGRKVDVVEPSGLHPAYKAKVLAEAVAL